MEKVGIDSIALYTSHYYLDLKTLAAARGVELDKFYEGLGQRKMAVNPPDEDIVSMAANAAHKALGDTSPNDISMVLFATETAIDQSKAAGLFLHKLLKLPSSCRMIELKQACYSATCGLQLALSHLQLHPKEKILLIASDIARYGLNTSGESSQGGGAVAMLLSTNPKLLAIEPGSGVYTEDAMDFWRPNYRDYPLVDGKFSCNLFLKALRETWKDYQAKTNRKLEDHHHFCYHTAIPKLAEKAHQKLHHLNGIQKACAEEMTEALLYNREIGNCYTASLYISLISLIENSKEDLTNHRIGFYSYGSGCVGEFFSGTLQEGYQKALPSSYHKKLLAEREELTEAEYEAFYNFEYPEDGCSLKLPRHKTGTFRLAGLNQHKRSYEKANRQIT